MISLLDCHVIHKRYSPKAYSFRNLFFWFKIDLLKLDAKKLPPFISHNRFNLYSFYDNDHIKINPLGAKDSYLEFLQNNNVHEPIVSLELYTHLRCIGYVFNPVSFIFAMGESGKRYGIIEIGNTFNELKPYFVPSTAFHHHQMVFDSEKLFYISPFIDLDNQMTFKAKWSSRRLTIAIKDYNKNETILDTYLVAKETSLTRYSLLKRTLRFPLMSLQVISSIHWHALKLWLKKIPFHKKSDNPQLQQGIYVWKK